MAEGQFDKDFGYLMPFLDKVASATGGIADTAAREELTRLIADEKQRWARIRQLLSGSPGQPSKQTGRPAAKPLPRGEGVESGRPAGLPGEPLSFTVGSLRPRSK
ncbi:MAG TPA: hypothetical protein VNI02_06605 [Blastocatellia bacterium]|jgi:hypothetical protein|nr:hypothetical protein [Blastocatellia bacterium]